MFYIELLVDMIMCDLYIWTLQVTIDPIRRMEEVLLKVACIGQNRIYNSFNFQPIVIKKLSVLPCNLILFQVKYNKF